MPHRSIVVLGVLLGSIAGPLLAQVPASARYKGVFWYESGRPVATLKYQVYDLDRGEYDRAAVDRWLDVVGSRYPGHGAYLRDIRTDDIPGATEPERLAHAIDRERRRWADLNDRPSPPLPVVVERPRPRAGIDAPEARSLRAGSTGGAGFDRPSPGSGAYSRAPASPFPYPYRSGPR